VIPLPRYRADGYDRQNSAKPLSRPVRRNCPNRCKLWVANRTRASAEQPAADRTVRELVKASPRRSLRRQAPEAVRWPRCRLCRQRLERTRRGGTHCSPQAERRSLFEHRPFEGRRTVGGAVDRIPVRNNLLRGPAQGRDAGGMLRPGSSGTPRSCRRHVTSRENSAKSLPNRHLEIAEIRGNFFALQDRPSEENCPCGKHPPLSSVAAWLRCR
jgi:hypothetical protein